MTDPFGFKKPKASSLADRVKEIRPNPTPDPDPQLDRIDAVASAHGFVSRDRPLVRPDLRRKDLGPTIAINTRVPERVAIPFMQFCRDQRMVYWEGIEELMKRCGLL